MSRSITEILASARNVLLFGVGGGNDSVTILLLAAQLESCSGFRPGRLQVAAMLPDVLRYTGTVPLDGDDVIEITTGTRRWVGSKCLREFPEPLLAAHQRSLGVDRVIGFSMARGSDGLEHALRRLIRREGFDLVLACDVGGDFIATPENLDVLSPMMDAYALSALRRVQDTLPGTRFLYGVLGLGTDGESTPDQLRDALARIGPTLGGRFEPEVISPVETFYRKVIEPNRHSRTADFTLRGIHGEVPGPTPYRARFHTRPDAATSRRYYGTFTHQFDPDHAGRYFLFESLAGVSNPFERSCSNGLEWFLAIQTVGEGLNHELNGQSYAAIRLESDPSRTCSLYFGTPSRKFTVEQRALIASDVASSIANGVFDAALVPASEGPEVTRSQLEWIPLEAGLALLTRPGLGQVLRPELERLASRAAARR